jgi:hypothetical protein
VTLRVVCSILSTFMLLVGAFLGARSARNACFSTGVFQRGCLRGAGATRNCLER